MEICGPLLYKKCSKCSEEKPLEFFIKCNTGIYNRRTYCNSCNNEKRRKKYISENKESILAKNRQWYLDNKDERADSKRLYYQANKPAIVNKQVQYAKNKKQYDPYFALKLRIRDRLSKAVKYRYKKGVAVQDLGCSIEFLKHYLESQFQPGMTFANIHIDHIRPLASFDLTDLEQLKQACHYTNLQPLWPSDNLKKGDKYAFTGNA